MEETIGKRIAQNRKRMGLTQDQLAEQLGITAQAVSKWENDQSCPDITMLPKLAEIFGISTDNLLGVQDVTEVYEAEVMEHEVPTPPPSDSGKWVFHWDSGRKNALGFAVLVLAVGILTLLSNLLNWDASFWEILWPSALLVFGLFGLYPRFSFFRFGCLFFGTYFLLDNLNVLQFSLSGKIIFPALVILFGLSLLADALKKPKKGKFKIVNHGSDEKTASEYTIGNDSFSYEGSFGDIHQRIDLESLSKGKIDVSFGSFTIDLSGVQQISDNCQLDAECSFGELTILVPRRFRVQNSGSIAFAQTEVENDPDPDCTDVIHLSSHANFGQITTRYI